MVLLECRDPPFFFLPTDDQVHASNVEESERESFPSTSFLFSTHPPNNPFPNPQHPWWHHFREPIIRQDIPKPI